MSAKSRFRLLLSLSLLLVIGVILAGCSPSPAVEAADEPPVALPAGQDAVSIGPGVPPLGPSLGTNVAVVPERLEIPAINVETDVVPIGWQAVQTADGKTVSTWEVADYAAGWHKNSALPGEGGNVVMSGHNNIRGAVFRKLYTLQPGDIARVWAGGREYDYRVEQVMIVEEKFAPIEQRRENARWIQPFADERLTLVSCWPENDNTHRVIVVAKPVDAAAQAGE